MRQPFAPPPPGQKKTDSPVLAHYSSVDHCISSGSLDRIFKKWKQVPHYTISGESLPFPLPQSAPSTDLSVMAHLSKNCYFAGEPL